MIAHLCSILYRLLIFICLCGMAKVYFQWYIRKSWFPPNRKFSSNVPHVSSPENEPLWSGQVLFLLATEEVLLFWLNVSLSVAPYRFVFRFATKSATLLQGKLHLWYDNCEYIERKFTAPTLNIASIFRESIEYFRFRRTANSPQKSTRASYETNKLFESNESRGIRQHS